VGVTTLQLAHPASTNVDRFWYEQDPVLHRIAPLKGSVVGNTQLVIYGSGFSARLARLGYIMCSVANTIVQSTLSSDGSSLRCRTPRGELGRVAVEVTQNQIDATSAGITFEYIDPCVSAVYPAAGPIFDNTLITIVGSGLLPGVSASFGTETPTSCSFDTPSSVLCLGPTELQHNEAHLPLRVWLDESMLWESLALYRSIKPHFGRAAPLLGPRAGGTIITVLGSGFGTP
jgi:hypothetical protein